MNKLQLVLKYKNNVTCSYCQYIFNEYKLLDSKIEKELKMCVEHI